MFLYKHERRRQVAIHTTYSEARANLARLWDEATQSRETVIISRRGADDVALIAADELASLQETAHLLRSPANAARLLTALQRALADEVRPSSVEDLRREAGLAETP
jgi:antitoxin YefM